MLSILALLKDLFTYVTREVDLKWVLYLFKGLAGGIVWIIMLGLEP